MSFQGEIVRDDLDINIKTIDKNAFKYVNNKKKVNIVHRIILPWSFFSCNGVVHYPLFGL